MAVSIIGDGKHHIVYQTEDLDATDASSNFSSEVPVVRGEQVTLQLVWTGVTSGTATVQVQASVDGTNWDDISGASLTTSGTSGSDSYHAISVPGAYWRLSVTAAASAGTATGYIIVKGS